MINNQTKVSRTFEVTTFTFLSETANLIAYDMKPGVKIVITVLTLYLPFNPRKKFFLFINTFLEFWFEIIILKYFIF